MILSTTPVRTAEGGAHARPCVGHPGGRGRRGALAVFALAIGGLGASVPGAGHPVGLAAQSPHTAHTVRLDPDGASPPARVEELSFLTGRWIGEGLGGEVEELWSAPAAGTMVGTFRLIREGSVVFYEFLALEAHEGTVALRIKHFDPGPGLPGWEERDGETLFPLVGVDEEGVRFSGLTFRREGPDALTIFLALRGADQVVREEVFRLRRAGS